MAFTPADLARIIRERDEVAEGWTQKELDTHWANHVRQDSDCEHHCCCCCNGLAAGEHF